MSHTQAYPQPQVQARVAKPGLPSGLLILAGLLIPLLGYVLLPLMGVSAFSSIFNFNRIILLFGAMIGGVVYLFYFRSVLARPQLLVVFITMGWPIVTYVSILLLTVGINTHLTPLLLMGVAVPAFCIAVKNRQLLLTQAPWFKYYLIFLTWLALYHVFYNARATDPHLSGSDGEPGLVSVVQLSAYYYCLAAMAVTAVAVLKARNYRALFDGFNKLLIIVSSILSLMVIIGYPLNMFNLMLDGFLRATGIYAHPNPFSHHMGILMVYLFGLFCYYQDERKHRLSGLLLWSGIAVNFVAFLLGFSKTALAVFAICTAVIFLLNLAVPAVRRSFLKIMVAIAVLIPVALFGFEALSGQSFMDMLQSRMDDQTSLNWRSEVWQDLLAGIRLDNIWFGHGFTSANDLIYHLTFNDAKNAHPLMMVHNAYIALIYDLGLMGYMMFVSAISLLFNAVKGWMAAPRPSLRTEHSIVVALVIYFLVVCGFDEMSYMFDAPMLFWTLATMLFCISHREAQSLGGTPQAIAARGVYPSPPRGGA